MQKNNSDGFFFVTTKTGRSADPLASVTQTPSGGSTFIPISACGINSLLMLPPRRPYSRIG